MNTRNRINASNPLRLTLLQKRCLSILLVCVVCLPSGCRRFSGRNVDISFEGPAQLAPGATQEYTLKIVRHWDHEQEVTVNLVPSEGLYLYPGTIEIKSGERTASFTVEVSSDAVAGPISVKATSPDAFGASLTIDVTKS